MKSLFKIGEIISYRYWMWTHKGLFSPHTCKGWPKDIPMEGTFQKSSYLSFRGVYGIKDRSAMYEWLAREDVLDSLRRHWFSGPDYGYGFFEPIGLITGTVRHWGRVDEGAKGYTSQFASVKTLDRFNFGPKFGRWLDSCEQLEKARSEYAATELLSNVGDGRDQSTGSRSTV